tara:strand:- start:152 stop:469 length:318 start_codon:yes stop_codon:yes gene_type:complete
MTLKQKKSCKHLKCQDCGDIDDIGWWTAQDGSEWTTEKAQAWFATGRKDKSLAPLWHEETMKARAKRHIKEKHMGERSYNDFATVEEGVASLMYVSQCIDWVVSE